MHGHVGVLRSVDDAESVATLHAALDVGVTLLMVENYRSGWVWECFGRNGEVARAFERAGIKKP